MHGPNRGPKEGDKSLWQLSKWKINTIFMKERRIVIDEWQKDL